MAIAYGRLRKLKRSDGDNAVSYAAYINRERFYCESTGEKYNYRKGAKDVLFLFGLTQEWQCTEIDQIGTMWNLAEAAEKRINSVLAREWVFAIPFELSIGQTEELIAEYAAWWVDRYKAFVNVAVHQPSRDGDNRNFHAHFLTSVRRWEDGKFTEKIREQDDQKLGPQELELQRAMWAQITNKHFELANETSRIDMRSYRRQGSDLLPQVHKGRNVVAMERRHKIKSSKQLLNKDIRLRNKHRKWLANGGEKLARVQRGMSKRLAQLEKEKQIVELDQKRLNAYLLQINCEQIQQQVAELANPPPLSAQKEEEKKQAEADIREKLKRLKTNLLKSPGKKRILLLAE